MKINKKLLFIVNVDSFFLSHRLPIATAAIKNGYEVHLATQVTGPCSVLEAYGLIVHPLSLDRSSTNLASLLHLSFQFWRIFKKIQPDIVHLVTIKPVLLGGLIAKVAKIPGVVLAISGLGFVFVSSGMVAALRRWLVVCAYRYLFTYPNLKVIFQNIDDCQMLIRLAKLPLNKVTLIRGSGVDLECYKNTSFPKTKPIVMLAARMLSDKGVREFVAAAQQLSKKNLLARFVLVGDIDSKNPNSLSRQEIDNWARQGIVEFWGHQNNMENVIPTAHIVVLPSYREGLPKVLLEAAACGRPVITTDVPGCRDAINPGVSGVLVPAKDVNALAKAIQYLLLNPALCRTMGREGRVLAEQVFDEKKIVGKHLEIYSLW